MKKVFLIFLSLIFIFTFQVKAITLEDITSGKFQSKDIAEVYPSADGLSEERENDSICRKNKY